jgi:hypothetical protein
MAARSYLTSRDPADVEDPHVLALVCNALLAVDPRGDSARPYLARLDSLKRVSADGKLAWWEQPRASCTMFYATGRAGSIETTALASLALFGGGRSPDTVRGALAWLAGQKDSAGAWHTTQATVLALKALIAGTGKPLGSGAERRFELLVDGRVVRSVVVPPDQADVLQQVDLTQHVPAGNHRLTLREPAGTASNFQVVFAYHVPRGASKQFVPAADEALSINVDYDRNRVEVGETLQATATIANRGKAAAPMLIAELAIPAGFVVETADLTRQVAAKRIAKSQLTPRHAVVYLRSLRPNQKITIDYSLRATMPAKVTSPPSVIYEYYSPDRSAQSSPGEVFAAGSSPAGPSLPPR